MPIRPSHLALALTGALVLAACGGSATQTSGHAATSASTAGASATTATSTAAQAQAGFEGIALEPGAQLAPAGTTGTRPVHGISCGATEQLAYHIHAHLAVYVDGLPRALPGGIGIPGSADQQTAQGPIATGGRCIYWLHTHTSDGVIHVESPTKRIYTLGDFFAIWRQPLSSTRVAGASGHVSAFVDGRPWPRSPSSIPLDPHAAIQLDVGLPLIPFRGMSWSDTQL